MSAVYNAMACFLMIVPFGARSSGLSGLVINIISLNILANAGTEEFASSTDGLHRPGLHHETDAPRIVVVMLFWKLETAEEARY